MSIAPLQLTICRVGELAQLLKTNTFDAIISIKDPSNNPLHRVKKNRKRLAQLSKYCATVLCLDFEDNEFVTPDVVTAIVEFAKTLPLGARVLVHCMAGRCRSTAAGIIALRVKGMDYTSAFAEVLRVRPIAAPNATMLRLYSEAYTLEAESVATD